MEKNTIIMSNKSQHKYEYEIDLDGESTGARIVRMIGRNRRVLELGAGPGSITKHLKNICNCTIIAIENDEQAIEKLSAYCENIYNVDLNDKNWLTFLACEEKFDVVLAADVLEHVYDPWDVLTSMKGLINEDGFIIISLPHVGHAVVVANILDNNFEYRDWGLLDRTHIRFFGMKNIQNLLNNSGLKIIDAKFVIKSPEITEFADRWRNISKEIRGVIMNNQFSTVYQVVIKAVPDNKPGDNIDLMTLLVDTPKIKFLLKIKSILNSYLSQRLRGIIRKIMRFTHLSN